MRKLTVLAVGRCKDRFYEDASAEYLKRLSAYADAAVTEVKAAQLPEDPSPALVRQALETEGREILRRVPAGAVLVSLCVEGKPYTSEKLAAFLSETGVSGAPLVFVIGGSYGLSEEVKRASALRLSMSAMTFPHRLARVMLLEQLYRGFKIAKGEAYHK